MFEIKTWADADITPGPVRLAMEKAERKKAEREKNEAEGALGLETSANWAEAPQSEEK